MISFIYITVCIIETYRFYKDKDNKYGLDYTVKMIYEESPMMKNSIGENTIKSIMLFTCFIITPFILTIKLILIIKKIINGN